MTRWAREVSPENVLPEYPRPTMVRSEWLNLNGLWDYAVTAEDGAKPEAYDGRILVPFPIESALSGVKKGVGPQERLWYHHTFDVPEDWRSKRLLIHFGAVDREATVWVNDQQMGDHRGGYDPFTFDITSALNPSGSQEITVAVWDPTNEGYQPRGKQVLKPRGFWYTPVTGIWQTVWLEPVERERGYIKSLETTPNIDTETLTVTVHLGGSRQKRDVRAVARAEDRRVAEAVGAAGKPLTLSLPDANLWSPKSPFLYDLEVTLLHGDDVIDRVQGYFGMRKISLKRDSEGVLRLALNNEILFQYGPLDQGYWPDGLFRAATDEALRHDIEMTQRLGFNMLRKHIKVEPQRYYYWCDKLGMLVWQDMPSGDIARGGGSEWGQDRTPESARQFELELARMIDNFYNHPSIITWVIFNEGWGQYDTERLTAWVKERDPSRLVINASGFMDKGVGDIHSVHAYPGPTGAPHEKDRALVLGEFGGRSLSVKGHLWREEGARGSRGVQNSAEFMVGYENILRKLHPYVSAGISAAVYTQLYDVEIEKNGIMTYDRAVVKLDVDRAAAAAHALENVAPGSIARLPIMPTSQDQPQTWRYVIQTPPEGWNELDFDDSFWKEGPGGFGDPDAVSAVVRTAWTTPEIWLRQTFEWSGDRLENPHLVVYHDFEQETYIYLNEALLGEGPEHQFAYTLIPLTGETVANLKKGRNLLAVYGKRNSRRQYVDVGLVDLREKARE